MTNIVVVNGQGQRRNTCVSAWRPAGRANTKGDYVISLRAKEAVAKVVRLEGPDRAAGALPEWPAREAK